MALPKRAIIAITSVNVPFYEDGAKTGLFYGEAVHPWHAFTKAGYEVDFVSESGNFGVDDHSISTDFLSQKDIDDYNDKNSEVSKALAKIKMARDVDPSEYGIFFASAGHATLFDYPTATNLQKIASEIYENGGVVAAVCHGPAIFANITDHSGTPIIKGKKVTAFTDKAEEMMNLTKIILDRHLKSCETIIAEAGGCYIGPPAPFVDFHLVDGRIVTGPNPASATSTAEAAIEVYEIAQK